MNMRPARHTTSNAEAGFTLVEIIVSMFLLALLALSFLPLVVQSLRTSSSTTTLATATRLVSEELETVRATGAGCPADNGGAVMPPTFTDPRGVVLELRTDRTGTCPGLVTYDVWVTKQAAPTVRVAAARTLINVVTP